VADKIHPTTYEAPRFSAAKRALVVLLFLAAVSAGAWFGREALLRGAAELWVVSDVPRPADAVAVFGGGLSVRPAAAAEYYREGLVKKILISNIRPDSTETLGIAPSHTSLNRAAVLKFGVPETAIELFGTDLSNTNQEVVALRDWALRVHARSIIVPTQDFSSRRLRWMLKRGFAGTGILVQVTALSPSDYDYRGWWRSDQGLLAFQNEVIKYVYYRFKY
jgi:uncharacterized SAM-binding protein YcdF (DUF218 family)